MVLAFSSAYAAIDDQIAQCGQSDFPDLCLASISAAEPGNGDSGKSEEELVAGCETSPYRNLCISAVARSLNKREICGNIADNFEMEACFKDFDSSLQNAAASPTQDEPFNFASFSIMLAIIAILYILYRRKKRKL